MNQPTPRSPAGLQIAGKRLWRAIAGQFELEQHEAELLTAACRTADVLERLDDVVRGAELLTAEGRPRPALIEQRQQQIALARLLAALRLPDAEDVRPQRRSSRGVYQVARRYRTRLIADQRAPVTRIK
jgi:hypothetical protein